MDRWTGCFMVSLKPSNAMSCIKVATSLMFSPSSRALMMPSMNVIFLNGDKVQGTDNLVIEKLSDPRNVSELLVSKLGCSVNVWVLEASTYNESFAVYKELIPSLTSRGKPKRDDPSGFPALSAIVAILSKCFEQENCGIFPCICKINHRAIALVREVRCSSDNLKGPKLDIKPPERANKRKIYIFLHCLRLLYLKKIADRLLLNNASISFVVHGTPRQWCDHHRPWICKEKDTLLQILKDEARRCEGKLQADERFYFVNNLPSLQMHFEEHYAWIFLLHVWNCFYAVALGTVVYDKLYLSETVT